MKSMGRVPFHVLIWVGLVVTPIAGCVTGGSQGNGISVIHLFGMPVALNLDPTPGPDGIGIRIYASAPGVDQGIEIRQGSLEVLMLDGVVTEAQAKAAKPRKVWSFTSTALRSFAGKTSLGSGYQLALRWGKEAPPTSVVTIIARYRSPRGQEVWSTASTVSVLLK